MKKAFYPIIASSLALALSANVAVAANNDFLVNTDKQPEFTNQGGILTAGDFKVSFNPNSDGFKFQAPANYQEGNPQQISFGVSGAAKFGTLTIDFADRKTLTQPSQGKNYPKRTFTFYGNHPISGSIIVNGGEKGFLADTQFKAVFKQTFTGNITLNNYTENNWQQGNNITFEGDAGLKGEIQLKNGYLRLNIDNGEVDRLVLDKGTEASFTNPKLDLNITGNGKIGTLKVVNGESDITLRNAASLGFKGASTISSLTNEGSNTITAKDQLTIGKISVQEGSTTTFKTAITNQSQADRVVIKGKDAASGNGTYKLDIDANNQKNVTAVFATTKDVVFDTKANVTNNAIRATVDLEAFKSNEDGTENVSGDFKSYRLAKNDNNTETTPPPLPPISEAEYLG